MLEKARKDQGGTVQRHVCPRCSPLLSYVTPRVPVLPSMLRGDKRDSHCVRTHNRASLKSGLARRQPSGVVHRHISKRHPKKAQRKWPPVPSAPQPAAQGRFGGMGGAEGFEKNSKKKRTSVRVENAALLHKARELRARALPRGSRGGKRQVKIWRRAAVRPQNRKEIKKSRCTQDVELLSAAWHPVQPDAQAAALSSSVPETLHDAFELVLGTAYKQMLDLEEVLVLVRSGTAEGLHKL